MFDVQVLVPRSSSLFGRDVSTGRPHATPITAGCCKSGHKRTYRYICHCSGGPNSQHLLASYRLLRTPSTPSRMYMSQFCTSCGDSLPRPNHFVWMITLYYLRIIRNYRAQGHFHVATSTVHSNDVPERRSLIAQLAFSQLLLFRQLWGWAVAANPIATSILKPTPDSHGRCQKESQAGHVNSS